MKHLQEAWDCTGVPVLPPGLMAKLCHMGTLHPKGKNLNSLNNLK